MTDTAVEKTLAVLEALADHSRLTDIARVTGLPKSTVHRLLQAMVDRGFAAVRSDGGYLAGPKVLVMAGKVLRPVDTVERARPALRALREESLCTVHLAMLVGDELVYVDKVEADKPYRMPSRLGMGLSVHCSAIGKAVLGSLAPAESDAFAARLTLTGRTPNTITTADRLRTEVAQVRRVGYGFDDEENEIGIRCVGAAIRDHTGAVVGGISASTLAMEHTMDQLAALAPRVVDAAETVSTALGYVRR